MRKHMVQRQIRLTPEEDAVVDQAVRDSGQSFNRLAIDLILRGVKAGHHMPSAMAGVAVMAGASTATAVGTAHGVTAPPLAPSAPPVPPSPPRPPAPPVAPPEDEVEPDPHERLVDPDDDDDDPGDGDGDGDDRPPLADVLDPVTTRRGWEMVMTTATPRTKGDLERAELAWRGSTLVVTVRPEVADAYSDPGWQAKFLPRLVTAYALAEPFPLEFTS